MARQPKKGVTQTDIPVPAAEAAAEAAPPKAARKTTAAKASAAAAEKKPAVRKAAPRKTAGTGAKASAKRATSASEVSPEQRYRMIQDAAYFIAERNGFVGDNHAYWLEAEQAIDAQLAGR
jgi:hypothetical protein